MPGRSAHRLAGQEIAPPLFTPALGGAATLMLLGTALFIFSGHAPAPLLTLYLLPLIMAAVWLGRAALGCMLALALGCRLAVAWFDGETGVAAAATGAMLLAEAVPVLLVAWLTGRLVADARQTRQRLQAAADLDGLTGVLTLQAFTPLLAREIEQAKGSSANFALLVVDVEGLRRINGNFGHDAGDRALKAVAGALRRSVRTVDVVARYGGDEFVVHLSGAGLAVARVVANRIRHNVATTTLDLGARPHRISVGIGIAVFPTDGHEPRDLLNKAVVGLGKDKEGRRPVTAPQAAADPA